MSQLCRRPPQLDTALRRLKRLAPDQIQMVIQGQEVKEMLTSESTCNNQLFSSVFPELQHTQCVVT